MTDHYHSLVAVLTKDIRSDDAEQIINAIKMVKGVLTVTGIQSDMTSIMAEARARTELGTKLFNVIYPDKGK